MTLLIFDYESHLAKETAAGGWFDWGGTPSIRKQRCPKVSSGASEPLCRGLNTNAGLTVTLTKWVADTKVGVNEQQWPVNEALFCQTSYPGGNFVQQLFFLEFFWHSLIITIVSGCFYEFVFCWAEPQTGSSRARVHISIF